MYLVGINKLTCLIFKDSHDNKINNSNKIANNFFNDFFYTTIGTKLANKISSLDSNYVSPLKSKNQQNSFIFFFLFLF